MGEGRRAEGPPIMPLDRVRWVVCRRPLWIVAAWAVLTAVVVAQAPDLTRLAAEGQARLLPSSSESAQAADEIQKKLARAGV